MDYLSRLDHLIAKRRGALVEGLRMAREEYPKPHQVRELELTAECPLWVNGHCGLDHSVACRSGADEPPDGCPLRSGAVVVRLKRGDKC